MRYKVRVWNHGVVIIRYHITLVTKTMQNGLDMAPVFQPTSLSDRDAIDGIQTFLQPRDTSVRSGPCSDSPDSNLVGV